MWMHIVKKLGITAFLFLLLLSVTSACNRAGGESDESETATAENGEKASGDGESSENDSEDGEDEEEDEAVPVEVVELGRGRIESILRFSTNLEAESEVQVFSEAARKVTQLLVEEGDIVRKGQVLIRLQNEAQQTELARVKSQLENARQEYIRQTNLYEQQLISVDEYNDVTYQLEQLELSLQDAEREMGYTQVRAPISGTITERFVNVGDYVTVNQHLFDIIDFDSIVARIYVPEKELSRLRRRAGCPNPRRSGGSGRAPWSRGPYRSAGRSPQRHGQGHSGHPSERRPAARYVRHGRAHHRCPRRCCAGAEEGSCL